MSFLHFQILFESNKCKGGYIHIIHTLAFYLFGFVDFSIFSDGRLLTFGVIPLLILGGVQGCAEVKAGRQ